MENVPWDVGLEWGCHGGWLGLREKGKGEDENHAFWSGKIYTFIISMIFDRGRYGLIQVLLVYIIS